MFAVMWLLATLTGHDPWKQDEPYVFGGVLSLLRTGDWVVPAVAGLPFLEKPPLFHWVAAGSVRAFGWLLPAHDAARLACVLFAGVAVAGAGWAAARVWRAGSAVAAGAVLVLLGSPGVLVESHLMITDVVPMAGAGIAAAGFALAETMPVTGAVLVGTAAGVGFLGKGLLLPAAIAVTVVSLALVPVWRPLLTGGAVLAGLAAAAPWLLVWPLLLQARSPVLFHEWLVENNLGRFLGWSVPRLGAAHADGLWLQTYPWYLFPGWLLVVCRLRRVRERLAISPGALATALLAGVIGLALAVSASARHQYAMPLLPLVAVLAAGAADFPPRMVDRLLRAGGVVLGATGIALGGGLWITLLATGHAPEWGWLVRLLPRHFDLRFSWVPLVTALALGGAGWLMVRRARGLGLSAVAVWASGLTLCYAVPFILLMPWIDTARSFRVPYESLRGALGPLPACVSTTGFGESERAMLDYFLGIRPEIVAPGAEPACGLLLVQSSRGPAVLPPGRWIPVWSGARPADAGERFDAFRRERLAP